MWRKRRANSDLGKHDPEYSEGIFLGMSGMGSELLIGTPEGVFRSRDVRALAMHEAKWNGKFMLQFNTSFEQYVDPEITSPDSIIIQPSVVER